MSAVSSVRGMSREKSSIRYRAAEFCCSECSARSRSRDDLVTHLRHKHDISRIQARQRVEESHNVLEADPADAVRSVKGVDGDPKTLTKELPPLPLPGHGEEYEDCGEKVPHFCAGCGEVHAVGQTCKCKDCPRCAPAWVLDRAVRAGSKLEGLRRALTATRGQSPLLHHLVFSAPEGFAVAREDPLSAGYDIVKELLDELGVDGSVIIYHPWSGEGGDDRGFWKDLLFEGNAWSDTVGELEYRPHFHVIALAPFVPGERFTEKLYEQTGWMFKRITKGGDESDSNVSIYNDYDLASALTYSLSHAGVSGEKDAYRYSGQLAHFEPTQEIEEEMDAVTRTVAPDTLGLPYRSTSCKRELDVDEETATEGATAPGPGSPDPELADRDDKDDRECGGKLLHIRELPKYLVRGEWCETIGRERIDRLIDEYAEWRGVPPPDDTE